MGHSMGGVVATALLPNPNISAIFTMSTPHTLPPVRFDRRIDHIYADNYQHLVSDSTPILSLCGGATDLMIPSESCVLPPSVLKDAASPYRRTIFTSALEGCWTGVGHLAMVWCHQVRWRVARAALEVAASKTPEQRFISIDRWLRDGLSLPSLDTPFEGLPSQAGPSHVIPANQPLLVREPAGTASYLIPVPYAEEGRESVTLVLYAYKGSILSVSPYKPLPFRATVRRCRNWGTADASCSPLLPKTLRLIPSPVPNAPFPVPEEGADESDGVVLFEADLSPSAGDHVVVTVEDGDRQGWLFGGFADRNAVDVDVNLASEHNSILFFDHPLSLC